MMATAPIALTGARVICPATGHDGIATILLKDRKVAGIGQIEPPSDATVIDARGLVVAGEFWLTVGERITVKINTEHYTAIGKITLEVV